MPKPVGESTIYRPARIPYLGQFIERSNVLVVGSFALVTLRYSEGSA